MCKKVIGKKVIVDDKVWELIDFNNYHVHWASWDGECKLCGDPLILHMEVPLDVLEEQNQEKKVSLLTDIDYLLKNFEVITENSYFCENAECEVDMPVERELSDEE